MATRSEDDVLLGTLKPAYDIYALYTKRVDDRVAKIKELLKQPIDFKSNATVELNRQKAPWPKDEAEADQLWRGRITNELLQEHLSEHPIEPAPQLVARRYDRLARNVHEQDKDEQMKLFLDALAQAYDPHSEYLSKADMKNFSINMGLSLVGIGAMLRSEDGYAKIESLVPGGPAQMDGRLKVGDRITAVAQGHGGVCRCSRDAAGQSRRDDPRKERHECEIAGHSLGCRRSVEAEECRPGAG